MIPIRLLSGPPPRWSACLCSAHWSLFTMQLMVSACNPQVSEKSAALLETVRSPRVGWHSREIEVCGRSDRVSVIWKQEEYSTNRSAKRAAAPRGELPSSRPPSGRCPMSSASGQRLCVCTNTLPSTLRRSMYIPAVGRGSSTVESLSLSLDILAGGLFPVGSRRPTMSRTGETMRADRVQSWFGGEAAD